MKSLDSLTDRLSYNPKSSRINSVPIETTRLSTILILISLTVVAVLIRAPDLGKWALTIDEYYFSRSVSFILEKGIPEFPDGGYYVRGISLQYLTAMSALMFDEWEFAVRLVPLIFGIVTIPLFYLLCRFYLPTLPSILCTMILVLSSWHIEFSRFSRMYSAFQFVFLAFLYFLYSGYWLKKRHHQIIAWALAFLAIFFYEGSVFLPFLLLLVLFLEDSLFVKKSQELIIVAGILLGLNYLAHGVGYRFLGVENAFPVETSSLNKDGPLIFPRLGLFLAVWKSFPAVMSYLLLVGGAIFVFLKQIQGKRDFWTIALVSLTSIFPLMHQFGLLIFFLLLFFLARKNVLENFIMNRRFWIPYLCASLVFWLAFGFLSSNNWASGASLIMLSKKMAISIFLYPEFYRSVFNPFAKSVPIWGFLVMLAISISVIRNLFARQVSSGPFLIMVILSCLFILGIFKTPYMSTRYSFFFFPIVLIIGYTEIASLGRWIEKIKWKKSITILQRGFVFIPLIMFSFTEDFNLQHILHVSSKEINFRMGKYSNYSKHWYKRQDFESPARFVNNVYQEGDAIAIDYVPSSFYLNKPFINYIPIENKRFRGVTRKEGTEEIWTGRPLVYSLERLFDFVPNDPRRSLWLIAVQRDSGGAFTDIQTLNTEADINHLDAAPVFEGIDGRIAVWQLSRRL
jgi:hypothetical protein